MFPPSSPNKTPKLDPLNRPDPANRPEPANRPDQDERFRRAEAPGAPSSSSGGGPAKLTQVNRLANLSTPLGTDVLALSDVHATEQLGRLFNIEIEAVSEKGDIKPNSLLGKTVTVEVACPAGGKRYLHGYVNQFAHSPRGDLRYYGYHLNVVPWLWFLTRQADCRIFNQKTVRDIVQDVFTRRGFSAYEFRLHGHYDPWEYCVQYRETDFNFISRLLEQEGMYYYFEHTAGEHKMVIADSPASHQPFPNYANMEHRARGNAHGFNEELLTEWQNEYRHHSGTYAQTDYDFTRPRVDLATHNSHPGEFGQANLEIYDYPGEYSKTPEGEEWAKVRMEEIRAERVAYHTSGNVVGLATGRVFTVKGPPGFSDAGKYLVTGTSIHFKTGVYENSAEDEEIYQVAATVIPAADTFRPGRLTPKPVIQGVQTAVVTGPKGEEIYTDQYGRIKVQFHWDRLGKRDENTTCWIRVGHHTAGKRWGASFIPRIGQEVIVAFLEGDPDQPLVVGSVYNGEQMPPYLGGGLDGKHANDKEVNGYKSCSTKGGQGFNEWRFTDTKGKEQIFIHAEKDVDTRVKDSTRTSIGGKLDLTVGQDKGKGGRVNIKTFDSITTHTTNQLGVQVDSGFYMSVGESHEHIRQIGDGDELIYDKSSFTCLSGKIVLEAESEICLKVGGNFVQLKPDGVYINGTMLYLNSGGSPSSATKPPEYNAEDPTPADDSKSGSPSV